MSEALTRKRAAMMVAIRDATTLDVATVGDLAYRLVCEIAPGATPDIDRETYRRCAARLLGGRHGFWALLACVDQGPPVGLLTLNECAAIYAGGYFAEIAELYVDPCHRSRGVAAALINAAIERARKRGWTRLEVGAPDLPRWQRTVDFYRREGFVEVGPRLKRVL